MILLMGLEAKAIGITIKELNLKGSNNLKEEYLQFCKSISTSLTVNRSRKYDIKV